MQYARPPGQRPPARAGSFIGTYRTCPAKLTMSVDRSKADLALGRIGAFTFAPLVSPSVSAWIVIHQRTGSGAGQGIRFELSAIRMASRYILGALARYRWRGARSGKSRQECQQARSGITVIAMSSFTAANPCRA